ncbi:TPA: NAD(P)-dependent oxidoreductase [Streptococcus suis]|uniref:NAD(P)-dependent oxidoreductase n=1 Tax=Streptococcus suis TaxID=1307 RepID=UPI00192D4751|nr:NAD(P)-dependent oxidoreductase [Streptococcus suis]QRA08821.1 NAD(P)-dependent oxidoreductase [Streptococcus suis]QWS31335.1 NAD(P)-dependent oxidoreductase [Streptococcus suis]QXT27600.1 NAD(P)-dependent oxidoreductase [Streptococcus suis]UAJ07778.1 NAD(P)-dependent oxidoreductase [Streptococcus suis]HEM4047643.1 NAD(P)-dependent oxidoreductase [Streptococcus suis]
MKIAIIAANGKSGQAIAKEAVERGHQVTAIVRSENKSAAQEVIQKDALDLTKEDLAGFDVVVNAFGTWTPETLPGHSRLAEHLATILADSPTRLLVVGGAGSLYLDESQTAMLKDAPDFPAEYLPIAEAMGAGLAIYRQATAINWTYISPAADFDVEGPKSGAYTLAGEVFQVNAQGQSYISYADYAVALVDIAEKGGYKQERISVLA